MTTMHLNANKPDDIIIAAHMLRAGEVVAMPTETVYGLAADALNPAAVAKIFVAKGRPQDNPLIVHINSIEQAQALVREFLPQARKLAQQFWPGPLTLILPKAACVPDVVTGGLDSVALRMPAHPAAQALLAACGQPLAAPSANKSGSPSPTTAQHVSHDMARRISAIVDGGTCDVGVESTVVSLVGEVPKLLRPGSVTVAQLEETLGCKVDVSPAITEEIAQEEAPPSPGMKYRHYAPKAQLTLVQGDLSSFLAFAVCKRADGLLVFDEDVPAVRQSHFATGNCCLSLGPEHDPEQQAQQLFAKLRDMDTLGLKNVFVRSPHKEGMGLAVYNRLLRAAAFREVVPKFVIGITGPTGAGKSFVAKILAGKGCDVIDCDELAREITQPGAPVLLQLAECFGAEVIRADGTLNRGELAARAFDSEANRQLLNQITHKGIASLALLRINASESSTVVIDAAVLLESELAQFCDRIIVIDAPQEVRYKRIIARDGLSPEDAQKRIEAQAYMDFSGHTTINATKEEAVLARELETLLAGVLPLGTGDFVGAGDHPDGAVSP